MTYSSTPLGQTTDQKSSNSWAPSVNGSLREAMDGWSSDSIVNQIYDGVQGLCGRDAKPYSVTFDSVTPTSIGKLSATSVNTQYTFGDTKRCRGRPYPRRTAAP